MNILKPYDYLPIYRPNDFEVVVPKEIHGEVDLLYK